MRLIKLLLSLLISGACIYLAMRKVDLAAITQIFAACDYRWIILATLIGLTKLAWMAFRWLFFIPEYRFTLFPKLFQAYSIGNMANMILPFRAGDLVRTFTAAQESKISMSTLLGTLASEHLLDFFFLVSLLCTSLLFYSYHLPAWAPTTIISFSMVGLAIIAFLLTVKKNSVLFQKILSFIQKLTSRYSARLSQSLLSFLKGFLQFSSKKNTAYILLGTLGIWVLQYLWAYSLLYAFNIPAQYDLGFEVGLKLVVMMGLAVIIPSSPSFFGTLHLLIVLTLEQMNVPKEMALSYAILAHGHGTLISIFIGLYTLLIKSKNLKLTSMMEYLRNFKHIKDIAQKA